MSVPPNLVLGALSINSKDVVSSGIFAAMRGQNTDGHLYVREALDRGASIALVEEIVDGVSDAKQLQIHNVSDAISAMARFKRENFAGSAVIGVTGSLGKTTTKEMIGKMLTSVEQRTHVGYKNFNNALGLSINLSNMPDEAKFGVFECGISAPGEMKPLANLLKPHIALITCIDTVHLEYLKEVSAIAQEKSGIFSTLPACAFINHDDPWCEFLRKQAVSNGVQDIFTFGAEGTCRLSSITVSQNRMHVEADILGRKVSVTLAVLGRHFALTAVAALGLARYLDLDLELAAQALSTFKNVKGRGELRVARLSPSVQIQLLDDSYNASPSSMRAALQTLGSIAGGRKVAILADMYELGPDAPSMHAGLADAVLHSGVDLVVTVGPLMEHLHRNLHNVAVVHCDQIPDPHDFLQDGDVVLIKGSFGTKIHKLAESLT